MTAPRQRRDPLAWTARRRLDGMLLGRARLTTPAGVVEHLTAVQAQDHRYARWSVAQRTRVPSAVAVDAAFDEGRILRTHVLRPTWHYVAPADLGWLMRLSGPRVQRTNAPKYRQLGLDARVLDRGTELIVAAVADGPRTRQELTAVLERARITTAAERGTYLLMHAELSAAICSGPMRGRQHSYVAFEHRVPDLPVLDRDEALAELAWRYFSTRGPATVEDLAWWSGLTIQDARRGLEAVRHRLETVTVEDRTHWLAGRARPRSPEQQLDLIACYDEIIVSYRQPRNALRHPAAAIVPLQARDGYRHDILLDGRLAGHWRPAPGADGLPAETRTTQPVDRTALDHAVGRFGRFTLGPRRATATDG
ncbi:MAG: winged helix DNA-binding domain-containing protein [Microbacteriaceae bacterium]